MCPIAFGEGLMSTPEQRIAMAKKIVDFEAERDKKGHIVVHKLKSDDGGGRYEVAGINERYNKEVCDQLVALVEAGEFDRVESLAAEFVASDTDAVITWTGVTAIESYLRDCVFNRGHGGGAMILQMALGVKADGMVGPVTRAVVAIAEKDPERLLQDLRAAREQYERRKRDERSRYWKGLVNRWNNALKFARTFLPAGLSSARTLAAAPQFSVVTFAERPSTPISDGLMATADLALPLPALRLGVRGAMVRAWQTFLIGEGFNPGEVDGIFDDATAEATRAFQSKMRIEADGVVGRQTMRKTLDRGFELMEEPSADMTGSNFPPKPNFPPLVSNVQRQAVFGAYDFVAAPLPGNKEHIRILGTWEGDNIVSVPIPQLKKTALGARAPATIRFHKLGAAQLQGLWKDWEDARLLDRILTFGGGFEPRFVRNSTRTLSNHSFGSAFDINVAWNQRGHRPALVGHKGSTRELVALAHKWGLYWGGHFSTPDGMHFEVALVKKP
jgi:peptidoglycan hydrolase-like protein with peptidoglycan-binding domain